MRPIKFRGQCLGSKKWIYGSLITSDDGAQIHVAHNELYAVDSETVGQFTGLFDKNDKEIYKGDIMRRDNYDNYVVCYGEYNTNGSETVPSDNFGWYLRGCSRLACPVMDIRSADGMMLLFSRSCCKEDYAMDRFGMNIIGNLHDNPELLKNE